MLPVNYWPATNLYWPTDYWGDYPAAAVIVTIAMTVYGPNPNMTIYGPNPAAVVYGPNPNMTLGGT